MTHPITPPRLSRSETFPYLERVMFYDGVPLAYFDSGGSGPAVVFVHGLGANLTHFEYVAPPLEALGYRVCGLDLPGFGSSGKPHREYTIDYFAGAVAALMEHLGVARATLCGHSLGGLVVARLGLLHPARVERLVLISTAGLFQVPLPLRYAAHVVLHPSVLTPALEKSAHALLALVFAQQNHRTRRFVEQSTLRVDEQFVPDLARVMWAARRDLTSTHLLEDAARLTMPTLVLWGGRDRLLPFGSVTAWASRLPDGELEVMTRCGHMPIIEDPEPVVARMVAFLARAPRAQAPDARC